MTKPVRVVKAGRPLGSRTFDKAPAIAFGAVIRAMRVHRGIAQEELAAMAEVERSHMGKIERGTHMPNLVLIFKLAKALQCKPGKLLDETVIAIAKAKPERNVN
jgi:transcriptional regulator with XRE-family HTH domain